MNDAGQIHDEAEKPEDNGYDTAQLFRTAVSLLFFVVLYYALFKSWAVVIALMIVLFIHEGGHFIAMKLLGYRGIRMHFVPFAGAYVSGETANFSNRNKLIVLLAGPLPGIIIGAALLVLHHHHNNENLRLFSIIFLLQNTFNLLPIEPLDGGQFFRALFFNAGNKAQLVILYLLLVIIIFISFYWDHNCGYMIFTVPLVIKLWRTHYLFRIHKKMDEAGINYHGSYDDLDDEEYRQIRNTVIAHSKDLSSRFVIDEPAANENELIPYIEKVLVAPYDDTLSALQKAFFALLWAAAFLSPMLLWAWHSGNL